ncbi:DUF4435 domain-containing protein [Burkholderia territorii]|uniref:DUF4435 domain-containing protein n=1 Tax=Burkholderia territorii TaxID=1503055 RepID=UPI000B1A82E2|nr:DUF4435 domain-containing protein [Burkholderia territorii]
MITPASLRKAAGHKNKYVVQMLNLLSRFPDEIIWVYEGKDSQYYGSRISSITGRSRIATIVAKGKKNVINIFEHTAENSDIDRTRLAFFVDKDFDATHPSDPSFYVTPGYSIENFYITDEAFAAILQNEFDMHGYEYRNKIAKLTQTFNGWRERMCRSAAMLNAWIFFQKQQPGYSLNLSDVKFTELFELSFNGRRFSCKPRYNLTALKHLFPSASPASAKNIAASLVQLQQNGSAELSYRGKYFMEFLHFALDHLKKDALNKPHLFFGKKIKPTLPLTKRNLLNELAQHATTPPCLRTFLAAYQI